MSMYSEKVMDHFKNPRNVGEIDDADGVGEVGNASCGDIMKIYLKVKDDVIEDVKFQTFGCGSAIATSSMVTEMVMGKTLEEAENVTNKAVAEALDGLPPTKMHCSNLAADALHDAIKNYREKQNK
jgi:nitrogen fixation NifU-like protein